MHINFQFLLKLKMQSSHSTTPPTATITFHCEYPTSINEHLHIIGNIPELGEWNESKAPQMYTSQTTYPIWYSTFDITYPIGKTIEYRYYTTSSTTSDTPSYESLPKRTITVKHPGQFIILTCKDDDKVKIKNISFPTTTHQLPSSSLFESNSKYVSSLKPIELISYENNKMGCDVINDALDIDNNNINISNKERVIFESLYLPVNVTRNTITGKFEIVTDENGSVQGMLNCMKMEKPGMFLWVGMLRSYYTYDEDELSEIEDMLKERDYYLIHPPSKDEWEKFIVFLHKIIFPIFVDSTICHDSVYIDNFDMYFDAFYSVNWKYGDAVKAIMRVSDFIIINDIDLALVPNIITTYQKNAIVGMYIHSPLPASDVIKLFPRYQDIIRSILLCDVIGFHSFSAARNFMTIMKRYFGIFPKISKKGLFYIPLLGRTIIIHIKQAQIDVNYMTRIQTDTQFIQSNASWERIINNKYSIVSFEHILLPQSIAIKFRMIELFLSKHMHLLDKVVFILWIKEFDDDNDMNTIENKRTIAKLQQQLQMKFNNNSNFIYIEYSKEYNIYKRLSLFKLCNVFLYTWYFEGHCIYANEFISLQSHHKQYGIILSESTTETIRFKSVIQTNMYNAHQMAMKVKECFDKKEQGGNFKRDYAYLQSHSTLKWVENFISDLRRVQEHDSKYKIGLGIGLTFQLMRLNSNFKHLTPVKFIEYYSKSKRRIMIFDYENTLVNIGDDILSNINNNNSSNSSSVNANQQLSPLRHPHSNHQRILKLMKNLSHNPNNLIFILSNCEQTTIHKLFNSIADSIGLCAEGGFYYKYPNQPYFKPLLPITDWSWKDTVLSVLKSFTEKTEESFIVEKKSYISWVFKKSDLYFGDIQANEIKTHLSSIFPELSIVNDYSSVTIKPANVNKAAFVAEILKQEFQNDNNNNIVDLITVIGDDYTDEEVFNYLNSTKKFLINFNNDIKVLTATIGSKPSNAEYYFNEINDCIENIEAISQYETNRRIRSSMSCTTLNMFTDKLFSGDGNDVQVHNELYADNKYYSQEINSIFGGEFTEFTL